MFGFVYTGEMPTLSPARTHTAGNAVRIDGPVYSTKESKKQGTWKSGVNRTFLVPKTRDGGSTVTELFSPPAFSSQFGGGAASLH